MTVKELKKFLESIDEDRVIAIETCHGFVEHVSSIKERVGGYRSPANGYYDAVGFAELTPELRKQGYSEDDIFTEGQKLLIFY